MQLTRRGFVLPSLSLLALSACGNGVDSTGGETIDARVDTALAFMRESVEGAQELEQKAVGVLMMPLITEAGFGVGGSFGRGALRVNDATVDYYSAANASFGFQFGAQQYAHALFFMTQKALDDFQRSSGWSVGADVEYALSATGASFSAETATTLAPVYGIVFGQAGLIAGVSLEGTKYTRIIA